MSIQMILLPLFVEVALTFALMLGMMYRRTSSLLSGETRFEDIAMREPNWPKQATLFTYAFGNQFELPVLFYVLTILAWITRQTDMLFVIMAWIFVLSTSTFSTRIPTLSSSLNFSSACLSFGLRSG